MQVCSTRAEHVISNHIWNTTIEDDWLRAAEAITQQLMGVYFQTIFPSAFSGLLTFY